MLCGRSLPSVAAVVVASVGAVYACGGSETGGAKAPVQTGVPVSEHDAGTDMSRCDFKNRTDREVSETAGLGSMQPNVRRVFTVVGQGEDARRVLICREVDTNLDGMKDVIRLYSDQGESLSEQADSNYDGKIDTWITFSAGRIGKLQIDTNHNGRPDETHYYVSGKLSRVERDSNSNGKPDVWEIYSKGHLQRMGVDLDHDGHVDRWDRDEIAARLAEEAEREEAERAEQAEQTYEEAIGDGGVVDARPSSRQR